MQISLAGRAALITGGSKGLGHAMALRFAQSGADVAILARNRDELDAAVARLAGQAGGRVVGHACDVTDPGQIAAAFARVMADLGRVDILVNNAGGSRLGAFETITDEVWQEDLDQKLMAAIRLSRLVWPQMKERRWGRILNVLSINAKHQRAGGAPTTVSRAAGLALTKVLSGEGAPHNILVNALMVGKIVSDQVRRQHARRTDGITLDEMIAEIGSDVPLGRMGQAEEFANVACFLASDQASYVSGVAIPVDGGKAPFI